MTTIFGEKASREELIEAVSRYADLTAYIKAMQEEKESIAEMLKAALEEDPTPIVDGEHGLVACLKERSKPAEVDFITLASKPEAGRWLVEAAQQGLITARITQVRGLKGRSEAADALLKASMPGGVTRSLIVEAS